MNTPTLEALRRLETLAGKDIPLPAREGYARSVHVFEREDIDAVQVAMVTGRPLLVRGEPGTGKSQLARAVAETLDRALLTKVVDASTETRDLLWELDAVTRLAQAQMLGAQREVKPEALHGLMEPGGFITPGVLWWAFDWEGALAQATKTKRTAPPTPEGWEPSRGVVVLVDEIDKADTAVPNALLDAFGSGRFEVDGRPPVRVTSEAAPFVVITTNEERALPDAFLRRCIVRHIRLPEGSDDELTAYLQRRATAHFPECDPTRVLAKAAALTLAARKDAAKREVRKPGLAEFIDLVRAATELAPGDVDGQVERLDRIGRYVLDKHPPEGRT